MIKAMLLLSIVLAFTNSTFAQWQTVGAAGCSQGYAFDITIATDDSGTCFICYNDAANGSKPTVQSFDGSTWHTVGNAGISESLSLSPVLQLNQEGTPYVAFSDGEHNEHLSLMKFDGTDWVYVGAPGFTTSLTSGCDFALSPDGTPYVTFPDLDFANKISVMKYNGSSWVLVGAPGFSQYDCSYPNIEVGSDGTPYVCYMETPTSVLTTKKFDGTSWTTVGAQGFEISASLPRLKLDNNDTPYVAYTSGGQVKVDKYTGAGITGWEQVGTAASFVIPNFFNLALNAQGIPFVVYGDYWNGWKASVVMFDGIDWTNVGSMNVTEDSTDWLNITIDKFGNPYVAYQDVELGHKVTVKKYGDLNGTEQLPTDDNELTLFPNPASNFITVHANTGDFSDYVFRITSLDGKNILEQVNRVNDAINVSVLPAGMYMLTVTDKLHDDCSRRALFIRQ